MNYQWYRMRRALRPITHVHMLIHDEPYHRTGKWVPRLRPRITITTDIRAHRRGGWTRG